MNELQWRAMAIELAQALVILPCTCVKRSHAWPAMAKERPDKECRRCRVLAKHNAMIKAGQAA